MKSMKKCKLNSIHADLDQWCIFAKKFDYIEIVEWYNGEGWDINICGKEEKKILLTKGQFDAIKQLIRTLENEG